MIILVNEDEGRIVSRVRGSGGTYETELSFVIGSNGSLELSESYCSCPMGSYCKHAAATLITAAKEHPDFTSKVIGFDEDDDEFENIVPFQQKPSLPAAPVEVLSPQGQNWFDRLSVPLDPREQPSSQAKDKRTVLVYSFESHTDYRIGTTCAIQIRRANIRKDGTVGKALQTRVSYDQLFSAIGDDLDEEDAALLLRLARFRCQRGYGGHDAQFLPVGKDGYALVLDILKTGRAGWDRDVPGGLGHGAARSAVLRWETGADGSQRPHLSLNGAAKPQNFYLIPTDPLLYLDPDKRIAGRVDSVLPASLVLGWTRLGALQPQEVAACSEKLRQQFGPNVPLPEPIRMRHVKGLRAKGHMRLCAQKNRGYFYSNTNSPADSAVAEVMFDYEGNLFDPKSNEMSLTRMDKGELVLIDRDPASETALIKQLGEAGFVTREATMFWSSKSECFNVEQPSAADWLAFLHSGIRPMQDAGWTIVIDPSFPLIAIGQDDLYENWKSGPSASWFEFEAGMKVDGEPVPLIPAIATFLDQFRGTPLTEIRETLLALGLPVQVTPGKIAVVPGEWAVRLLDTVLEFYQAGSKNPGKVRMPAFAAAVVAPEDTLPQKLKDLREKLREGVRAAPMPAPKEFGATLRPYQEEGLGWLRFLAEAGLGGVMADDMGLGKTVQALAHIQSEKQRGALTGPVLIVTPTSVVHHWQSEAQRFTPNLKVLLLHGLGRGAQFDEIAANDLVLTTYPLIARDLEEHAKQDYGLMILDEAQHIKNPLTKTYAAAIEIPARRHLALTGTPMENNLMELWSIFSFAQPGVVGEQKGFTRFFRTPIEKHGDATRREKLRTRIAPFMLRRTKDAVLAELPPKTQSVVQIDLTKRQVELYEAVRAIMEKKVRDAVSERGLARSQIVVLEALLKLRQVCCDPRLLKTSSGAACKRIHSAKLEALLEQLQTLVGEGRRILVFSQFVEMLELIKIELGVLKIPFLELTGQSRNRGELVKEFQKGDTPIFLISLKAGGSGLNLTAADTVIHYDPWWNPAVEAQATDRAHRIGQDKPVFVYKLITAGTVEEKIVALQEKKSELLAGILSDNPQTENLGLTEDIVADLLAPLR